MDKPVIDPAHPHWAPYFEKGHAIEVAHGKCPNCGAHIIDLAEDLMYGEMRQCARKEKP